MFTVKGFTEQLSQAWKSSTPAGRVGIVLLALLCATVIGGVGYWSSLPQYVELASNLEPAEFGDIVTELDRAGIAYEMKGAGNTLFVDRRYWSQAQNILRQKGPVAGDAAGADSLGMFPLPEEAKNATTRRLERSLKVSLKGFAGVQDADVYLSIPDRSGFLRPTSDPPRASISLTLQKGARFSEAQAAAMAQHVANSVVGLDLSNVAITDKDGRSYTVPNEELRGMLQQDELRRTYESRLLNNLQSMIGQILGVDNVSVRVAADVSVHDNLTTIKKLDAQNTVTTFEKTNSKTRYGAPDDAMGGAGTMTNVSGGNATGKPNQMSEKSEELETKTDSGHQIQETKLQEVKVNRLSVSVVANANCPLLTGDNPLTPDELKTKIETIVKGATGFVEPRDFVAVEIVPFAEPAAEEPQPVTGFPWEQVNKLLQNISLGIAAVLAFLMTILALRKFGTVTAPSGPPVQLSQDSTKRVSQLSELLSQNPEVFSRIIAAWADSSASDLGPAGEKRDQKKAA